MASDPALLEVFRKQLQTVLGSGDAAALLGLWVAWNGQCDVDCNDLVDVMQQEGAGEMAP